KAYGLSHIPHGAVLIVIALPPLPPLPPLLTCSSTQWVTPAHQEPACKRRHRRRGGWPPGLQHVQFVSSVSCFFERTVMAGSSSPCFGCRTASGQVCAREEQRCRC